MQIAELRIHHSRHPSATRRVAPEPYRFATEAGQRACHILCAAVVAEFLTELDDAERDQLEVLLAELDAGRRPPRALRHRIQVDTHGLDLSRHALFAGDGGWRVELDTHGPPAPQAVGAVVALCRLGEPIRREGIRSARRAIEFPGGGFSELLDWIKVRGAPEAAGPAQGDLRWAMNELGLPSAGSEISPSEVASAYRRRVRQEHPDHGADHSGAAERLARLRHARVMLSGVQV